MEEEIELQASSHKAKQEEPGVVPGSSIAGGRHRYMKTVRADRAVLENPDLIRNGKKLRIP